jgi:hypothetical protein
MTDTVEIHFDSGDENFDNAFGDVLDAFFAAIESDRDPDDMNTLKDALARANEHMPERLKDA